MHANGLIEESQSPWCNPTIVMKKSSEPEQRVRQIRFVEEKPLLSPSKGPYFVFEKQRQR